MLDFIDSFLNRTTMYRLVLYYITGLWAAAAIFSFAGILPYDPFGVVFSGIFIAVVSWITNSVFARFFKAVTNVESVYITAVILALIITPPTSAHDTSYFALALWASVWAMASKYIFAIKGKHIFNPAAFAVALTALTINHAASWWVGNLPMMPLVLLGGILMVRKLLRWDLVLSFFAVSLATILGFALAQGTDAISIAEKVIFHSSLLFFAFVMLTEPLTAPSKKYLRIAYGALVGFLFVPAIHIGPLYSTPELALLAGNIFAYVVSPKQKLVLILKEKVRSAADVYDFIFETPRSLSFEAGQYMEWTLAHHSPDNRGNRRYLTLASSPTENNLRLGVKFYMPPSTFKQSLLTMKPGDTIVASQLAGDFVLPRNKDKGLAFIAGGIGITPFRSMVKYMLDTGQRRPVTLLYSNKTESDILYKDVFDEAEEKLGIKTVYALTDSAPDSWRGKKGHVSERMIRESVPDYQQKTFYISGPRSMVTETERILKNLGVKNKRIITDFFPGFA